MRFFVCQSQHLGKAPRQNEEQDEGRYVFLHFLFLSFFLPLWVNTFYVQRCKMQKQRLFLGYKFALSKIGFQIYLAKL